MTKVRFRTCLRNTIYDALRNRPGYAARPPLFSPLHNRRNQAFPCAQGKVQFCSESPPAR